MRLEDIFGVVLAFLERLFELIARFVARLEAIED